MFPWLHINIHILHLWFATKGKLPFIFLCSCRSYPGPLNMACSKVAQSSYTAQEECMWYWWKLITSPSPIPPLLKTVKLALSIFPIYLYSHAGTQYFLSSSKFSCICKGSNLIKSSNSATYSPWPTRRLPWRQISPCVTAEKKRKGDACFLSGAVHNASMAAS